MPSGAKKRKALKKKKEAIGATTDNNHRGHDEHGSQDERDSDGYSSSQGNGEIWTRDLSPSPLSGLGKVAVEEKTEDADVTQGQEPKSEDVTAVIREMDHEENGVDKPPNSFTEEVVISDKNEKIDNTTGSDSVKEKKSNENEEKRVLIKEAKEGYSPGSAAETSKNIERVKESEVPECSEEKSLLPSGPPVVRTSWLSCCGLFDVMAGSER